MCFTNNAAKLKRFRSRKQAITVWKRGDPDEKTGLVTTGNRGGERRMVVWKLGEIVVPDRVRKPLKDRATCSHGLYFYTSKPGGSSFGSTLVAAKVDPKDIIAVSFDEKIEEVICCVKAKVIKAPDPDQRKMRIKYLTRRITVAKERVTNRYSQIKALQDQEIIDLEATQSMKEELEQLKKQKK